MVTKPVAVPRRATRPRLRVLPGRRRSRVWLPPWVVFSVLAIAMFFGLIYSRVALDRSAFNLSDLEGRISVEEARHQELMLQVARLEAPDRIAREAASLGLVLPAELPRTAVVPVRPTDRTADGGHSPASEPAP